MPGKADMPILRSHGNAWRFAELDLLTRTIRPVPLWRTLRWRKRDVDGWYGAVGSVNAALYRLGGSLVLQVGDKAIPVDDQLSTELGRAGLGSNLKIVRNGSLIAELPYTTPTPKHSLEADLTAGVEAEHFDFGLFLHNIVTDRARQARIASN